MMGGPANAKQICEEGDGDQYSCTGSHVAIMFYKNIQKRKRTKNSNVMTAVIHAKRGMISWITLEKNIRECTTKTTKWPVEIELKKQMI